MAARVKMGDDSLTLVLILLFLSMNGKTLTVHAISCQDAIVQMLPCQDFLIGSSEISAPCCERAQRMSQIAKTTAEEQRSVCKCFKQAALVMGVNVDKAKQIPRLCHIDLPSDLVDPNVDCDKSGGVAQDLIVLNRLKRYETRAKEPASSAALNNPNRSRLAALQQDQLEQHSQIEGLEPSPSKPMEMFKSVNACPPKGSSPNRFKPAALQPDQLEQRSQIEGVEPSPSKPMEMFKSVNGCPPKGSSPNRFKQAALQPDQLEQRSQIEGVEPSPSKPMEMFKSINGCPPKGSILPKGKK